MSPPLMEVQWYGASNTVVRWKYTSEWSSTSTKDCHSLVGVVGTILKKSVLYSLYHLFPSTHLFADVPTAVEDNKATPLVSKRYCTWLIWPLANSFLFLVHILCFHLLWGASRIGIHIHNTKLYPFTYLSPTYLPTHISHLQSISLPYPSPSHQFTQMSSTPWQPIHILPSSLPSWLTNSKNSRAYSSGQW